MSNVIKCESCQHRRECGNYYTCQHEGDKYYCPRKQVIQMRIIDADALEKFLSDAEMEATRQRKYVFASALNTICGNVRNFPTIEPERKKGKWIDDGTELGCCCSECGTTLDDYFDGALHEVRLGKMPKFCPNCGSYNGGEQDDD